MGPGRLAAFSDAVFAIIITFMVLELPRPEDHEWHSLTRVWSTFLAYILSFTYIGIYWNNHHHMLYFVRRISSGVLWANLHLLFWLSLLPFVTDWAGETHFAAVPMSVYAIDLLLRPHSSRSMAAVVRRANIVPEHAAIHTTIVRDPRKYAS